MRVRFRVLGLALLWMVGFLALFFSEASASGSPYFNGFSVLASNRPSGMKTLLWVNGIVDPEGSVPDTIALMIASGPNGFSHSFEPGEYSQADNGYYQELSGLPDDGEYILTVASTSGKTRISTFWLTVGETIPLPAPSTFQASGTNPLTPTLSWGAIPDYYSGTLFYRVWITDMSGTSVWDAVPGFNTTSVTVPSGVLESGKFYQWQVGAADSASSASANKRCKSDPVRLVLDNSRPYFTQVAAFKVHHYDDTYGTGFYAQGADPGGSVSSLVITDPNGVTYSYPSPSCFTSGSACYLEVESSPADGLYTFAVTGDNDNTAVSYFFLTRYAVPLVDTETMRASGPVLTPTLSWSAPASIDRPLYYQAVIRRQDTQEQVWWSGLTLDNSITVPSDKLQSGISYEWNIVANDSPYGPSSNRSVSAYKTLTIDDSSPYFWYVMVDDRNDKNGRFTAFNARVGNPKGSIPGSIASLTVDGPGGFGYSFQPGDYQPADNEYYHQFPGALEEGLYTFTVTESGGNSAVTHRYHGQESRVIPLFNEASFQTTGANPLAPTMSWSAPAGYRDHPYYRVRILDTSGNVVYQSPQPYSPYTCHTIPSGRLVSGKTYRYRIEAFDAPYWDAHDKRAVSNYRQGGLTARNPYFKNCGVLAHSRSIGTLTSLGVVVSDPDGSVPDTISSLTVMGPNEFTYSFTPIDYTGSGEYSHDLPGLPTDGEYTFTVTDIDDNTATSYFYLTVGETLPAPSSSSLLASGTDPLTPTLSCGTTPDYPGNLYYRAKIVDTANRTIWTSDIGFNTTSVTVPSGVLASGQSYRFGVQTFDNSGYYNSNKLGSSVTIPLNIDNQRPYLANVGVYKQHNHDDTYSTGLIVDKGDPSDTAVSVEVFGPNEFQYSFDFGEDCVPLEGSILHRCVHNIPASPDDGSYSFTFTNAYDFAVSYFYLTAYDVPLIESDSMQASGNLLAPTLSWSTPATIDQPLYYVVSVKDIDYNTVWTSSWTTLTSVTMPSGILQPDVSYQWQVAANDSKHLYSSNRSLSPLIPLSVLNSPPRLSSLPSDVLGISNVKPYFSYAVAYNRNTAEGTFTGLNVQVGDPGGTIPESIASLTVSGPEGFSYSFQPNDYYPAYNDYFYQSPSAPLEGLYTFTVTDKSGRSAVTYHYHRTAGGAIPLLNESGFEVSGDPLAPTISWSAISDYPYHLYYRVRIVDGQGNPIYTSSDSPSSYHAVPSGYLASGMTYQYRVEAVDCPDFGCYDNRAVSNYLQVPTVVELVSFKAKASPDSVLLEWQTRSELDNAGFRLWRARSSVGKYTLITKELIPANGSPTMGAKYSYRDLAVVAGRSYSYRLEDIDASGKSTFHGPVRAAVRAITLVSPESGASTPPKAPVQFVWESTSCNRFKIQISSTANFSGKVKTLNGSGSSGKDGWIKPSSYTPTLAEWKSVKRLLGTNNTLYWRVLGKHRSGSTSTSEANVLRVMIK
jgi:hypothetical protein